MIFIFTTNDAIGSRLIRWGTRSKVSHMMVARTAEWDSAVVEARGDSGVTAKELEEALWGNKVVRAFRVNAPLTEVREMWKEVISLVGRDYDYKGIAWYTLAVLLFDRVFGMKPNENRWADKNDYYCSEVMIVVKDWLKPITPIELFSEQMISPDIAVKILEQGDKNVIEEIDLMEILNGKA